MIYQPSCQGLTFASPSRGHPAEVKPLLHLKIINPCIHSSPVAKMLQCYEQFSINAGCRMASDMIVMDIVEIMVFYFHLDATIDALSDMKIGWNLQWLKMGDVPR